MKIEAYDLETLRKLVRTLQKENSILKERLRKANIPFTEENPFDEVLLSHEEYDPDQGGRIISPNFITEDMAKRFFSMFWGREDVYAKRGRNGGYFPQCDNRWNDNFCPKQRGEKAFCDECENKKWKKLELKDIIAHLLGKREDGSDVIGVYPLLPDGTCRFLVFDFDNHDKGAEAKDFANTDTEWQYEVDSLRKICELNGIKTLVERSRSGKGAHVWIFFKRPISASLARNFGYLLLDKGSTSINLKSFRFYDRMYPSQDIASSLGNLIALPLQGMALKSGNSAFVDEKWNAYPDQWDILLNKTEKLGVDDIEHYITKWQTELAETKGMLVSSVTPNRTKPWKRKCEFNKDDVIGKLHIVLSNGVYIDTLNIMPRLQNQIRSMAAFDNPEYYKSKRLGYSNYYNLSAVYQVIILVFYLVLIIIYALFPIKLAKGLYLCPLTEDDRKKYLMTAAYMRFGILMLIYGILLLINWVIYQPSIIILVLQYIFGSLLIFTITLLYIHPGIYSVDTAMQTYSALKKMPVNSKPKAIKVGKKTAGKSIALLIAVTLVCTVALFLPGSKKELNLYLWYYYIPAFICSVSCIVIYYKKYLDELISLFANQELYQYMKKKAGVFHAD